MKYPLRDGFIGRKTSPQRGWASSHAAGGGRLERSKARIRAHVEVRPMAMNSRVSCIGTAAVCMPAGRAEWKAEQSGQWSGVVCPDSDRAGWIWQTCTVVAAAMSREQNRAAQRSQSGMRQSAEDAGRLDRPGTAMGRIPLALPCGPICKISGIFREVPPAISIYQPERAVYLAYIRLFDAGQSCRTAQSCRQRLK